MFMRKLIGSGWWQSGAILVVVCGCAAPQRVEDRGKPGARGPQTSSWTFDTDQPGQVPPRWQITETNPTEAVATWKVIADQSAPSPGNVLALTGSKNYNGTYNLAVAEDSTFGDLDLTVQVKAVAGKVDQGGGPVWRYQDKDNYYVCRFNPLESNFRVYFVKNGKRKQLASATVGTQPGKWYTVRVRMVADHIECMLDGDKLLDVLDQSFPESGMVGLWTKADAVTSFDDLQVRRVGGGV